MSVQYTFEQRDGILFAVGRGIEGSIEEDKQTTLDLIRACKESGCDLLLVDDREVTYTISTISLYELAKFYYDSHFQREVRKVALVPNPVFKEDNAFYETAVRNRGLNLRVFYDFESAAAWLNADGPY
jgi:hypothetical protein